MKSVVPGFKPIREFVIRTKKLPHWEQPASAYFVTFSTAKGVVLNEEARDAVFWSVRFHDGKKYELGACVVMPDHVHMVLQPLEKEANAFYSIAEITHSIKSYSAKQVNRRLNRAGQVWLDESYDRIIRNEDELLEKMNYIVSNPVKVGLADSSEGYRWLFLRSD